MKLLSKKISQILKSVLLFSFVSGVAAASVVTSDRFLIKIIDRTVSLQDIRYQLRNLKALSCIYDDSYVIQFFGGSLIKELDQFLKDFPTVDQDVRRYLHAHEATLKKIRYFFKILRYSEDQNNEVSPKLEGIVREATLSNKCDKDVLFKYTLKTNFKNLLEMEIYFRARYGNQLKGNQRFEVIRSSIELFVDSLDKQFGHEYYW